MYIVRMNGGLGNQTFQYIFARYLEITTQSTVLIDDSHFFLLEDEINHNIKNKPSNTQDKITHNGYEMDYVFPNIKKPMFLSEYFQPDVWRYMIDNAKAADKKEVGVPYQLLENGMNFIVLIEAADPALFSDFSCMQLASAANKYNTNAVKLPGNVYYYGYWINPGWFEAYKETFLKELSFRPISDPLNKQYEYSILNSFSIGAHIRRGDFVRFGWTVDEDYYNQAITHLVQISKENNIENYMFFVFSDDIEWCRQNAVKLGLFEDRTVFVEGNYDYKNNYIDMQLMAMCDVLIPGNSSFSYLACLFNQKQDFFSLGSRSSLSPEDIAGTDGSMWIVRE